MRVNLVLAWCLLLSACAAPNPRPAPLSAAAVAGKGMVVGEVHILGKPEKHLIVKYAADQKIPNGGVDDGLFGTALPPGDYALEGFMRFEGDAPGALTMVEYSNWPFHRSFTVRAGEVTNLGEIIFLPSTTAGDKQFRVALVDNSADAPRLFKERFPQLVDVFHTDAMLLAPGEYSRGEQLTRLRTYIASEARRVDPARHYVAGPAGTLAVIERDKARNTPVIRLLDSGTTVGLLSGGEDMDHDRFAFRTTDGKPFLIHSGHIQPQTQPEGADFHQPIYLAGEHLAVQTTDGFGIYISRDDGRSWTRSDNPVDTKGENPFFTHYRFVHDATGMFVYRTYPARVFYAPLDDPRFGAVTLPPDVSEIRNLSLVKTGIVLETTKMVMTTKSQFPLYVRARSGGEWQLHHVPRADCAEIHFPDDSGLRMRVACGRSGQNQTIFSSTDGGEHWDVAQ